jgi:hypothetical protein
LDLGSVGRGDLVILAVTRDHRQDADTYLVEQRFDLPKFPGEIIFANNIDIVGSGIFGFTRADHMVEQRLAAQLVAQILAADETGRIDGDDGLAELVRREFADRFDIVADQGRDTGLIDEDRRRIVFQDDFFNSLEQLLLRAMDDVQLAEVGREIGAVKL